MILCLLCAPACTASAPPQEGALRGRGGFTDSQRRLALPTDDTYCAAEVLRWRYDHATGALQLADDRVLLGCCGRRGVQVERVDSMIEITERDTPHPAEGRCDAACAFDAAVVVQGVPAGHTYVKLLRDVTDTQGGPELVWAGTLDLATGAGEVVLDPTPAPGCGGAHRPVPAARRGISTSRAPVVAVRAP